MYVNISVNGSHVLNPVLEKCFVSDNMRILINKDAQFLNMICY